MNLCSRTVYDSRRTRTVTNEVWHALYPAQLARPSVYMKSGITGLGHPPTLGILGELTSGVPGYARHGNALAVLECPSRVCKGHRACVHSCGLPSLVFLYFLDEGVVRNIHALSRTNLLLQSRLG